MIAILLQCKKLEQKYFWFHYLSCLKGKKTVPHSLHDPKCSSLFFNFNLISFCHVFKEASPWASADFIEPIHLVYNAIVPIWCGWRRCSRSEQWFILFFQVWSATTWIVVYLSLVVKMPSVMSMRLEIIPVSATVATQEWIVTKILMNASQTMDHAYMERVSTPMVHSIVAVESVTQVSSALLVLIQHGRASASGHWYFACLIERLYIYYELPPPPYLN